MHFYITFCYFLKNYTHLSFLLFQDCEEELSKVEQKLQSILESPKVESTACQDCPKCPNCPNCPNCPQCPSHPPCPDSNAIQQTNRPWLIIGIPTIPRQQSYLTRTLKTIDRELEVMNSVLSGKVSMFFFIYLLFYILCSLFISLVANMESMLEIAYSPSPFFGVEFHI